jgi:hypothetical protein
MQPYCEVRFGDLGNMGGKYHGRPIDGCGHKHRTLGAARKCMRRYFGPQGEHPFYRGVYINDGKKLVPDSVIDPNKEDGYLPDSTRAAEARDSLSE